MRTRALFTSVLASVSILVVGWQLSSPSQQIAASTSGTASRSGTSGSSGASGTSGSSGTTAPSSGTYTGATAEHRYGSVAVTITVADGAITDATVQDGARDGRSRQIASYAEPILRREVLAAQSAEVGMVSGATYTSRAYHVSLQAALDEAGQ